MNRKVAIDLHEMAVKVLDNWRESRRRRMDWQDRLKSAQKITPKDWAEPWALFLPPMDVIEKEIGIKMAAESYWERQYFKIIGRLNDQIHNYLNKRAAEKMMEGL